MYNNALNLSEINCTMKYIAVPCQICSDEPIVSLKYILPEPCLKRISYTYLHGKLSRKAGYDIFMFLDNVPTEAGIYLVDVIFPDGEVEALLCLWKRRDEFAGLCVALTDNDGILYAIEKFREKSMAI
jgi:hypothetical protein